MALWSGTGNQDAFSSARKGAAHLDAVERLKSITRERFVLSDEETVMVIEEPNTVPGCPPVRTVVAFWTLDGQRHHFSAFKRVEEVLEEDIPPAWLKASLAFAPGVQCACC